MGVKGDVQKSIRDMSPEERARAAQRWLDGMLGKSNPSRGVGRGRFKPDGCMTPLAEWFAAEKTMSLSQFARDIGVCLSQARRWAHGLSTPSLVSAFLIDRLTRGGVPPSSWMGTELARREIKRLKSKVGHK